MHDVGERLARGDLDGAFEALHRAHQHEVARLVRLEVRTPDLVQDVCQDVWTAVRRGLPRFRMACAPRVWILSIARRRCADARRGRARGRFETLDSDVADPGALGAALGLRPQETPSRELHLAQRRRALHDALGTLAADERELLELRYVVGLKPVELKSVLGLEVSANGLSQRLVRIARRLRELLADRSELESFQK